MLFKEDEVEDDDDDDEGDDDALESDKSIERELHVEIEPIVNDQVRVHDIPPRPAYAKHEPLVQHKVLLPVIPCRVLVSLFFLPY